VRRPGERRCTTVGLTRADPVSFVVGALVTLVAVIFTVRWSPATQEIMQHSEWMLVAGVAIGLMIFGIGAGMGWTVAGSINLAGENAIVRNFACGAALGAVALFGLGSHGAAHKARYQRRSSPGAGCPRTSGLRAIMRHNWACSHPPQLLCSGLLTHGSTRNS
jgi:hypothetical protein